MLLILLWAAIYLELPRERKPAANKCELRERGDTQESAETYAQIAASGHRDVRSRRVTVIPLREDTDPARILNNVCEQRWYLARLVPQLADAGATAIVFDKFFGPDSCDKSDEGTSNLICAVQRSRAPVVVGVESHVPQVDPKNVCLILSGSLNFGDKRDANGTPEAQSAVKEGITRLNSDPRKIPLNWFSYQDDMAFDTGKEPTDTGTLSSVAATLVDKDLQNESGLVQLRATAQHPFSSFISPDALSRADALSILCTSPAKAEIVARYNVDCAKHPPSDAEIRGRVVVIGEDVPGRDRHTLLGNDVAGVYLQANYIESLLDDRYLRPFGAGWNLALLALWVVFLYLVFWIQPEVALVISLVVGLLVRYSIIQLVLWKGLYPEIWVQELGTIALALKYIESRGHRIIDAIKERQAHQPSPVSEK